MNKIYLVFLVLFSSFFLAGCLPKPEENKTVAAPEELKPQVVVSPSSAAVPLPTGQSSVRTFLTLISEKRIPEAVGMLSVSASPDESTKQAWGVNFNSIKNLTIKQIEDWDKNSWTDNQEIFKATINLEVGTPGEYNWENGENVRWITVSKNPENLWQIESIATGP